MTHLSYPVSARITCLLLLIFMFLIGTYNTLYAQELITNGDFNTNTDNWSTSGWTRIAAGEATNNIENGTATISQTVSNLNSIPAGSKLKLTFFLRVGDFYDGHAAQYVRTGYGTLSVVLGGVTYATFKNPASSFTVAEVNEFNGATVTPDDFYFDGTQTGPGKIVTILIPWVSKPNSATLSFISELVLDDFYLDNISILPSCTAPVITTQPAAQTVCTGAASFSVAATGTGLTYQWYKNGVAISGATSATYNIPSVTAASGANYNVIVSSTSCTTASSQALLTITPVPITPTIPATATNACPATTVNITALVTSTLPAGATLEFYTSNTPIPANLVAAPATVSAGTYYAFYKSSGGCYSAASTSVVVTISVPCPPAAAADLRPLYVMTDVGFIKPSALTKNATLRVFNVGDAASVAAGLITVYIYPPNNQFSIAMGAAPGWSMAYDAGGNYYTLTSTSTTVAYGAANFKSIPLVITAAPAVSKGKYTINFEIADGSGGETNNLNNTVPIEVTVSGI